jgi:hypothetical protein
MTESKSNFHTVGNLLFYKRKCPSGDVKYIIRMDLVKCANTYPETRSSNQIISDPENPIPGCYFDDARFTGQDAIDAWALYEQWIQSTLTV